MSAAFDTLAAARDLEAAGMDRAHAEAVAGAIRAGQGELATKADLNALRTDMAALRTATKADLDTLRTATKADLAGLEARITWRIVGLVIAANAVLVAAVKLLP